MKRILVIEDTEEVRNLIAETLRRNSFAPITAEDGVVGLETACNQLPDLILCDVRMPRMDGYEVLSRLQENAATKTIPFIFLTGLADKPQVRQGMELGADDYLIKPFLNDELLAAVKTRLEKEEDRVARSDRKLVALRDNISMALPHELMTPLNGIVGFASVLSAESGTLSTDDVKEYSTHIHNSALRLHRVIENFLLYSQIELVFSDPAKIAEFRTREAVPLSDLVARAARNQARQFARETDLILDLTETQALVRPQKMEKVLMELLDNAFKFSSAGSSVIITTREDAGRIKISITDHGRGMTPEQIASHGAHMQFERKFYEQQGSGLGLVIARRLVQLMDGSLHIQSTPRHQTVVEIGFPSVPTPALDPVSEKSEA